MRAPFHETGAARLDVLLDSGNGKARKVSGLLDTGAPMSFVTRKTASEMGLEQRGWVHVGSMHGGRDVPQYYVIVTIDGIFEGHGVVSFAEMAPDFDFVVIGRNVLERLRFTFDGPAREFELVRP